MKDTASNKKNPILIVVWSVLGLIILALIVIEGTLFVQKYIKKIPVPMFMGYATLIVSTGSMNGTINEGDMIIIKATNDYSLGKIVTFIEKDSNLPVTHRIVNYDENSGLFKTKGDANNSEDSDSISVDQIVGEVVAVIPNLGLVFGWFIAGGGLIYLVAMIAIVVGAVYLWKKSAPSSNSSEDGLSSETETAQESTEKATSKAKKQPKNQEPQDNDKHE